MVPNELIKEKKWWAKRKWLLLAVIVLFTLIIIVFVGGLRTLESLAKAYADKPLFSNAVAMAQNDTPTKLLIGNIPSLDDMAIANGSVEYSDNNNTIAATIPVKASVKKGKLDIVAYKIDGYWKYTTLKIRIEDPKKEIDLLANQE